MNQRVAAAQIPIPRLGCRQNRTHNLTVGDRIMISVSSSTLLRVVGVSKMRYRVHCTFCTRKRSPLTIQFYMITIEALGDCLL